VSPKVERDRVLADDFARLARMISDGKLTTALAE
jgi:hypothetical protein